MCKNRSVMSSVGDRECEGKGGGEAEGWTTEVLEETPGATSMCYMQFISCQLYLNNTI
jgi:hypothetical protein